MCEGQKHSRLPKIELVRREISLERVCRGSEVLAYVTNVRAGRFWEQVSVPVFGFDALDELTQMIVRYYRTCI